MVQARFSETIFNVLYIVFLGLTIIFALLSLAAPFKYKDPVKRARIVVLSLALFGICLMIAILSKLQILPYSGRLWVLFVPCWGVCVLAFYVAEILNWKFIEWYRRRRQ
jgi:hypothetical protein